MIGDLNQNEIEHLLQTETICRIGCHADGETYVVPSAYAYHEGCLYAHSGIGMKVEMMRVNPKVCVEIDHIEDLANWRSVILWGTYEELEGEEAEAARERLVTRLAPQISEQGSGSPHPWDAHGGATEHILHRASRHGVIYRIRITAKTGRYEKR